ncbi:8-hydroxygeraniol dehydrogenase-like [Olea europaea subsp. europaea]|uniref:8-hydroxygeraniol dehydrogenase-like n=1 Tax=Olea europaea subsp. europaea TaxID=158383 RepID=A0A8S0SCG2_OLEEU|nr:8-hydroxygeraniol dehydrogenase-like [Olea europaea subsp. europaea]
MAKFPETEHPPKAFGWGARDTSGVFSPVKFSRRETGERDVQLKVLYCGICHTDLHMARNDWGFTQYPLIPGHEIVGEVTEISSKVTKFKVGDKVGVGCLVGSCRQCDQCTNDLENYCSNLICTYGSVYTDGTLAHGGYSNFIVVDEHFVVRWPENLPIEIGSPLLCARIMTYSPLRYFGLNKPGMNIGVVGLGHVTVKFGKAFGTKVTIINTSIDKKKEAIEKLGADLFLVSRDPEEMKAGARTLDGIIDTVAATHPLLPLIMFPLISSRKIIAGSEIGEMKETQEMLDFAAKRNILPDVEMIPIDYVNTTSDCLAKSDVKYRFVIDIAKSLKAE